jgi:hypothetical protein
MPQSRTIKRKRSRVNDRRKLNRKTSGKIAPRYTVGLSATLAGQVERYAETVDTSMSKAIAALVRLGLEGQENRKREFFKRLKENLADDDPKEQDRIGR